MFEKETGTFSASRGRLTLRNKVGRKEACPGAKTCSLSVMHRFGHLPERLFPVPRRASRRHHRLARGRGCTAAPHRWYPRGAAPGAPPRGSEG